MNSKLKNQSISKQKLSSEPVNVNVTVERKVSLVPSFGRYRREKGVGFNLGVDNLDTEEVLTYLRGAKSVTIKVSYDVYSKNMDVVFSLREQLEVLGFSAFVSVKEVTA